MWRLGRRLIAIIIVGQPDTPAAALIFKVRKFLIILGRKLLDVIMDFLKTSRGLVTRLAAFNATMCLTCTLRKVTCLTKKSSVQLTLLFKAGFIRMQLTHCLLQRKLWCADVLKLRLCWLESNISTGISCLNSMLRRTMFRSGCRY